MINEIQNHWFLLSFILFYSWKYFEKALCFTDLKQ